MTTPVTAARPAGIRERSVGLDLARALAVVGMVIVHAYTELVLLPAERLGAAPPPADDPAWATALQWLFTDRARALFILLAGVGVTLVVRRTGAGPRVLARRAVFLGLLGVGLVIVGWSDLILVLYGIWFLLAIALVRLPTGTLLAIATTFAALPVFAAGAGRRDDFLAASLFVVGETGWFVLGLALGRGHWQQAWWQRRAATIGALAFALSAALLTASRTWHDPWGAGWTVAAAEQGNRLGWVLLALTGCLMVGRLAASAPAVRVLAAAGSMPLTLYVAQALFFIVLTSTWGTTLAPATLVSAAFLVCAVTLAHWWVSTGRRGPVEGLMRRWAPLPTAASPAVSRA